MSTTEMESNIDSAYEKWQNNVVAKTLGKFPEQRQEFVTASGQPVERLYVPSEETAGDYYRKAGLSRRLSVHARRAADDVSRPVLDDAAVRGLRHGRGIEQALPLLARARHDGLERGVRPADADWLRLGRSHGGRAKSARWAWRSIRWPTWKRCSPASRSTRCRPA